MARTRTASGRFGSSPQTIVVRQAAPVQKKQATRRRSRRRASSGSSVASFGSDAMAGVAYGLLERMTSDIDLPEIPVIGRKGTLALALYLFRKSHPMINDAARAGIIISTYQLASEGKITGE